MLFIHTSKSSGPIISVYDRALQIALSEDTSQQITLHHEYTDLWLFEGEDYARTLRDFYRQKYSRLHPDLILVESAPALKFLLAYGDELFPGTPVVLCIMEGSPIEGLTLKPNFTGVLAGLDFKQSLASALRLQPDTRRVFVVSGTSPMDQGYLATARRDFQQFEGEVEFTYLTDLPLAEIERQVSELPEHSIVFYVTLYRDATGQHFPPAEAAGRIGKATNAPFYSIVEAFTTAAGGVGGYLWSLDADAMEVSKTVRQILAGAQPKDIPVHVGDSNRYIFDWRQLRRWGIDEKRLPAGSIVKFKQPTFWEQYKWHSVGAASLLILEGLLIVGLLINRSRRRLAERENERFAELAKAEHHHLGEVISNVPGVVWETRLAPGTNSRTLSFVSEQVEKMLGYSVDECMSSPDFAMSIVTEEDRERVKREAQAILESGKDGALQFRWVTKDGRTIWAESQVAVIHDEAGKPIGLRGVTLDVTERKRAETGLKDIEARLAGVISSAMDAIISIDKSQQIVLFNPAAESMFSCPARDAIGQPLDRFIPERFRAAHKDYIRAFGEQGLAERSMGSPKPIFGRKATGEDFPIEASISRTKLNGQNFYTVILRDISERKQAELEAQQQRSELAHLSRVTMLGELSGSMAHELNQPLTAILSNAQAALRFLAHDDVDLDEVRDILADIVDQDNRAGEIIRRLRVLLKKGEVQQRPLDVNDLVREVLKLLSSDLANQNVSASTNLALALPTVTGDRVQLQQVLLNLLINACDAMSGVDSDRQIVVSTEMADGAGVRFSVSDRGAGISAERLEHVFDPFFTTKTHGLGLGLSVCRTIITAHGGKLWAANNPERGATFCFTLPVSGVWPLPREK